MIEKKNIVGVDITNASKNEILEYIVKSLENFKKKYFVVTPNPEFLVLANKNLEFKNILNRADLASADGIGIIIAAKFLGQPLKGRFTGVDLVESLCKQVVRKPLTVGFLGGRSGVAEETAECLQFRYPKLNVVFAASEWPETYNLLQKRVLSSMYYVSSIKDKKEKNIHNTKYIIHDTLIDILFVAFGAPKQEFWISENLDKIPVKIAIGVGGAFDYISGRVERAPTFIQNIGLEWLYRLINEPWRIKRQLSLLKFAWLVFKERLNKN